MVRRHQEMIGIYLDRDSGLIFLNESYEKWLKSNYGRKFPPSFIAALNDLLDSALLETLDDMKKVIRFYEWRQETQDRKLGYMTKYIATLEESLQRVTGYANGLEKSLDQTKATMEEMEGQLQTVALKATAAGAEVAADAGELGLEGRRKDRSTEDILAELQGVDTAPVGAKKADIKASSEMDAEETEADMVKDLERPAEMDIAEGRRIEDSLGMGARLVEAEIGADDIELTPQIAAIKKKIDKVKKMKALGSDEEIERMFEGKDPKDY